MTVYKDGQVSWYDRDTWSGRMYQERSAATTEKTLPQSSKQRSGWPSRKPPLFLYLKKAGPPAAALWETDGALRGGYSMHSFGECPRDGAESHLSQILEDTPHRKYFLSAKACQGVLNRAARRGKDLPEAMKTALLMQSESGGGCDGGGKGALVQEEKSGTLGCNNDQTIFCAGFKLGNGKNARGVGYAEELAQTLNAECGGNKPAVLCLNDQGGSMMGVSENVSGTLRAQEHGQQPSIWDVSHACDVIRDCGGISPSLQARMGTGGNQVPLTYQMQGFGDYRAGYVASSCKQRDSKGGTDLVCAVDCRNGTENPDVNGTLQAKSTGGQGLNLQNVVRQSMTLRRLTPLECERLQGFPDGWTDIGDWGDGKGKKRKTTDSARYKALGNSIALPPWKWVLKRLCAQYERDATMASLFDGIGGFPLIWEQLNGKGSCLWASEIEEFPMAVTRKRFGGNCE